MNHVRTLILRRGNVGLSCAYHLKDNYLIGREALGRTRRAVAIDQTGWLCV